MMFGKQNKPDNLSKVNQYEDLEFVILLPLHTYSEGRSIELDKHHSFHCGIAGSSKMLALQMDEFPSRLLYK